MIDAAADGPADIPGDLPAGLPDAPFDESEWQRIEDEETVAQRRVATIQAGRRKGGIAGAAMAGAMFALQEIYEGPKKDEMVSVSESPDEPGDIDKDGIEMTIGDVDLKAELPDM